MKIDKNTLMFVGVLIAVVAIVWYAYYVENEKEQSLVGDWQTTNWGSPGIIELHLNEDGTGTHILIRDNYDDIILDVEWKVEKHQTFDQYDVFVYRLIDGELIGDWNSLQYKFTSDDSWILYDITGEVSFDRISGCNECQN